MKSIRVLFFCMAVLSTLKVNAQGDANKLLQAVYSTLQKTNDYSVQAHIIVDIPAIHILPVDVSIYYKKKDKFKVISKGIAIVPQQGFNQASKLLSDPSSYTAIIQGTETVDSINAEIINVIPISETTDIVLGKLWVDPKRTVILKAQYTTRSNGTIEADYRYKSQAKYGLPDKIVFIVDIKKFKVPMGANDVVNTTGTENEKLNKKGKIIINLSNYQVNKGVPDNVFQK